MRGIDGFVPGVNPEKYREKYSAENSPENIAKDFNYFQPKFEQPIGPDQYDYIRRITDQLKDVPCKRKDIRAIGILGKDVYDKLLILRALREEFPNVIFFTTDIDARYWHHTELQYTRGLVVASSYGLQLCHIYQGDILQFRSSYQTSLFTATLLALDIIDKAKLENNTPRIYEIGWRGPYDLTSQNPHKHIHTERNYLKWNTQTSYFFFLVILSWVVLYLLTCYTSPKKAYFNNDKKLYPCFKKIWNMFRLVSGIFFVVFFCVALISSSSVTGEPITLLDGISIWPTNLMRLFCGFLSLYLFILSIQHIKRFHDDCSNGYHYVSICKNAICKKWHEFHKRKREKRKYLIGIGCLLHTFTSFGYMFYINSPLIPTRGNLCFLTDKVILCGGFSIMSLLTCYIVIDTYYFWRFMQDELLNQIYPSQSQGIAQQTNNNNKSEAKDIIKLMHIFIFIAKKTEVSGKITTYPFIALFLVILSRNSFFENLTWTLPISIVIGLTVIIILFSAILLFYTAKDLRHRIIHSLNDKLLEFKKPLGYKGKTKRKEAAAFLEFCIQYIENLKIGAFAPLSHNSIFISLLTPFGGIGTASLIQYLFHRFS
ncbi:MAG: hypothetical protein AABY84_11215 [Candidatus Firestonebacteria bacterium]